jgi:hypothetical protein
MLQRSLAVSVASLLFGITSDAAEDREFTGREAEAIALATKTFKSEQSKNPKVYGDLSGVRRFHGVWFRGALYHFARSDEDS